MCSCATVALICARLAWQCCLTPVIVAGLIVQMTMDPKLGRDFISIKLAIKFRQLCVHGEMCQLLYMHTTLGSDEH